MPPLQSPTPPRPIVSSFTRSTAWSCVSPQTPCTGSLSPFTGSCQRMQWSVFSGGRMPFPTSRERPGPRSSKRLPECATSWPRRCQSRCFSAPALCTSMGSLRFAISCSSTPSPLWTSWPFSPLGRKRLPRLFQGQHGGRLLQVFVHLRG
jgi:hypothetical protein